LVEVAGKKEFIQIDGVAGLIPKVAVEREAKSWRTTEDWVTWGNAWVQEANEETRDATKSTYRDGILGDLGAEHPGMRGMTVDDGLARRWARDGTATAVQNTGEVVAEEAAKILLGRVTAPVRGATSVPNAVLPGIVRNGGSIGKWARVAESMSARSAKYQAQLGGRAGQAFIVNGVKFDAVAGGVFRKNIERVLLEAKGPGYARFVKDGEFREWFKGAKGLLDQAGRQVAAANNTRIEWHVAEKEAADVIARMLTEAGVKGIIEHCISNVLSEA
jgi:hypothetical protein